MKIQDEQRVRQIANEQIRECLVETQLRDSLGRTLYVLLPPPSVVLASEGQDTE